MKNALIDLCSPENLAVISAEGLPDEWLIETIFRSLDLVPTPILLGLNPESTDIRTNSAGSALFGGANGNLSQSAAPEDRPNFQVYRDDKLVPVDELPMQRAGATGLPVDSPECELRFDDGTIKCIRGRAVPVFSRDGMVVGTIGVFFDVTKQREAERRIALLQEEVKHRAKNTMALIVSLARSTLKPKLDAADFEAFEARMRAIGDSVSAFMSDGASGQSIHDIVEQTVSRQVGPAIQRVRYSGDYVTVPLDSLASLSMALHELTTNACKYGSLSVATGTVDIAWSVLPTVRVAAIEWVERGGPTVVPPTKKGFGSRLLSRVLGSPAGLETSIKYGELGLECRLYVRID